MKKRITALLITGLMAVSIGGCSASNSAADGGQGTTRAENRDTGAAVAEEQTGGAGSEAADGDASGPLPDLEVRFGREGEPFVLHLEDNSTAAEIARYVGEQDWNLPIYHYDDFENYEVMQYYDIPSRYSITSNPEAVTSQRAGEVYYSEPNRIILFYQDAEIAGDFTRIGTIDATEEFVDAVVENPVVEGWSNKIVSISRTE